MLWFALNFGSVLGSKARTALVCLRQDPSAQSCPAMLNTHFHTVCCLSIIVSLVSCQTILSTKLDI